MYEEQGNIEKAIETYGIAALKSTSKSEQNSIYWKTVKLENHAPRKDRAYFARCFDCAPHSGSAAFILYAVVVARGI